jgi:2-iminobutanoate/2-iminopropanoate deaminase
MRHFLLALPLVLLSGCPLFEPPAPTPPTREIITAPDAPAAIGPYSHAIKVGNVIYCSGQIGLDPATGDLVGGDIQNETRQALKNLGAVLRAAGVDFNSVASATVYLTNMDDYKVVNEVYEEFFKDSKPSRAAVQVARLPRDARVEVSCIAIQLETPAAK